jgi:magnesium-transporting ATPase (P-type)
MAVWFTGMNILCCDKTGTLTLNKMVIQEEVRPHTHIIQIFEPRFEHTHIHDTSFICRLTKKTQSRSKIMSTHTDQSDYEI